MAQFFQAPDTVWTPRVLKDGSDSVGALGALNRVFVNIGLFSEEWLEQFIPFVGGTKFTPFEIAVARRNSSYWNATEAQTPDVALFFLATAKPDYLKDAPGGRAYLSADKSELDRGKDGIRGALCALPLEQAPRASISVFPRTTPAPGPVT